MSTYLELCNQALSTINEVQITSVSAGANTSIQDYVTKAVLFAIDDINQEEFEWPFNVSSTTQVLTPGTQLYALPNGYQSVDWESFFLRPAELITNGNFTSDISGWTNISTGSGTSAYTATGNGRLRLAGGASGVGASEQSIATIANLQYRIFVRVFGGAVAIKIGTSSGASDILNTTTEAPNTGGWEFFDITFTPTTATTFIGFSNSNNDNRDVDLVSVTRDIDETKLEYMELDRWARIYKTSDIARSGSVLARCTNVFPTLDNKFGLTPIPDEDYSVDYTYWIQPATLAVTSDIPSIPTRFHHVIVDRTIWYLYLFRENSDGATFYDDKYRKGIDIMRSELIRKADRLVGRSYFSSTNGYRSYIF